MHELTQKMLDLVKEYPNYLGKMIAFFTSIEDSSSIPTKPDDCVVPILKPISVATTDTIETNTNDVARDCSRWTRAQIADIRLGAKCSSGPKRRKYMAEISLKHCNGNARLTEKVFGWSRDAVNKGLKEKNTGIVLAGLQSKQCGRKKWEEIHLAAAKYIKKEAENQCQQDKSFTSNIANTRLTAGSAIQALKDEGFSSSEIPSLSVMAKVLNRTGYPLRKMVKHKPFKKIKETDAIFENNKRLDLEAKASCKNIARYSLDCKATVKVSESSRGGLTRGNNKASDHDFHSLGSYTPCGIVDQDTDHLHINIGSSFKTSDFIMDTFRELWYSRPLEERLLIDQINLRIDNGPESSGVRTQFLKRIVAFADEIGKPIQLMYYPPYYSKYNPIERCWGALEKHWGGTILNSVETMVAWAKTMTWKGLTPIVTLSNVVYEKGISLKKSAMKEIEKRLIRNPELPKYYIRILPLIA
jgi:transposase